MHNLEALKEELKQNKIEYKENEPLAKYTTLKIGGPADILVEVEDNETLIDLLRVAYKLGIPVTMLGWGSNVLIGDKGIRGLVIRNKADNIEILGESATTIKDNEPEFNARLDEVDKDKYYTFEDLDFDDSHLPVIQVKIDAGANLPSATMNLIRKGISGLQWFGGIPGTFGGAIYNNIHGGTHYLSEYIESVRVLNLQEDMIKTYTKEECKFDYDYSIFHDNKEIILEAIFNLRKGESEKAKEVYIEWTRRKKKQPQKSAGCMWQNISEEQKNSLELESTSWGYIIDKVLNLKGTQIGGAKISDKHAAFIENVGEATAKDVVDLMELIKSQAQKKLGIEPKAEIFKLGDF